MGYEHSLTTSVKFINPVTEETLLGVLAPLSEVFGWTPADILSKERSIEGNIEIQRNTQGLIEHLYFETRGDVDYDFAETAQKLAELLTPLAEPNHMVLTDHDSACLSDAERIIWFGDTDRLAIAKLKNAWETCKALLIREGVSEEHLTQMAAIANI